MLSARTRGARRTSAWRKWEIDVGIFHGIQEEDVGTASDG